MKSKYLSRKFLVCIAAMLSSVGTSIAGLNSDNQTVVVVGIVATISSAAIYAFCEAWVDQAYANNSTVEQVETVDTTEEGGEVDG